MDSSAHRLYGGGMTLRTKLFLSILATLTATFLILFGVLFYGIHSFVEAELDRTLLQMLSSVRREVDEKSSSIAKALTIPAMDPTLRDLVRRRDLPMLSQQIERWSTGLQSVDRIILVDRKGRVVTQTGGPPSAETLRVVSPLIERTISTSSPVISFELVYCPRSRNDGTGRYLLASVVVIPVGDEGAPAGAVVAIDILADDRDFLEGLLPSLGADAVIGICQQGEVVVVTSPIADGHLPSPVLHALERGEAPLFTINRGETSYRFIATPLTNSRNELAGAVTLAIPEGKFRSLAKLQQQNLTTVFLVASLLSFFVAWVVSRKLTVPLRQLTGMVQKIESGEFDERVTIASGDEIGDLAKAFNRMAATLGERNRTIETTNAMLVDLNERLERRVVERSRELAQKNTLQEEIISVVTDGVMVVDSRGTVVMTNHNAARLLGIVSLAPLSPFETLCREGGFCILKETIEEVRQKKERRSARFTHGEKSVIADLAPIVRDGEVETVVISLHDVTVEENIDRLKSDFIATVSHELRTPLTSMRGALRFIITKSRWLTGTERELLEICSRNTDRLIRLVTGILDITRIEQGAVSFDLRPTQPDQLVRHAIEELSGMALEHNVAVTPVIEQSLPRILGDHDRLVQVLTNMISNAILYSDEGTVIRVVCRREEEMVRFTVEDMNRTIPEDQRHKLFKKFQQIAQGEGGRLGGSGLGLAICREIVERHGGEIGYRPKLAGGNEFSFTIPVFAEGGS